MQEEQSSCCPERSWAPLDVSHGIKSLHSVDGELLMIGDRKDLDLEIYVAKPPAAAAAKKKAIVVFTDV